MLCCFAMVCYRSILAMSLNVPSLAQFAPMTWLYLNWLTWIQYQIYYNQSIKKYAHISGTWYIYEIYMGHPNFTHGGLVTLRGKRNLDQYWFKLLSLDGYQTICTVINNLSTNQSLSERPGATIATDLHVIWEETTGAPNQYCQYGGHFFRP